MVIFLISSLTEYYSGDGYGARPVYETNGMAERLGRYWRKDSRILLFAADPDDQKENDLYRRKIGDALKLSGFSLDEIRIFDSRTEEPLDELMQWADVLYLAGGHGPDENAFIEKAGLKEALYGFNGIFIGESAGALNAAADVLMMPELAGEASDTDFCYELKGLGLTRLNIIPHIQYYARQTFDGMDLIEDILMPRSIGRRIYLITDGSYFFINEGRTYFFGEGTVLEDQRKYRLYSGEVYTGGKGTTNMDLRLPEASGYDAIFYIGRNGSIRFVYYDDKLRRKGISDLTVRTYDELINEISERFSVDDEKQALIDQTQISDVKKEIKRTGVFTRAFHVRTDDGISTKSLRIYPGDSRDSGLTASIMDIETILDHDWMTDEYSREGFLRACECALSHMDESLSYSVIYANIDNFKALNTLFGRKNGDMIIFDEQHALKDELHPAVIGRLEADHFVILVENRNLTAESISHVTTRRLSYGSMEYTLHIRLGICHVTDRDCQISSLIDYAHLAEKSIRCEKQSYCAVFDQSMNDDFVTKQTLIHQVDKAIEKGELIPYFQPVVNAATKEIKSAESLIRWDHSKMGMLSPGIFIPALEANGDISKITRFMVDSVLDFNVGRMKAGLAPLPCAVNLSRIDFYNPTLMDYLISRFREYKDIRDMIKVEVTESAYAVLESDGLGLLNEMKELGIMILLDDFGSGMSSLSTLESFEFDTIKLDLGFIKKIESSRVSRAIIRSTIDMGHSLGATIVAEGVETEQQYDFLRENDCDLIQGYLFYKPMPEVELVKLIE
ncbi:MAG: EAL domain-containing protein [Lachnospiraceae bacterium]|nr:EAL domain-containing protein [Lachnospiraceae bacterium]